MTGSEAAIRACTRHARLLAVAVLGMLAWLPARAQEPAAEPSQRELYSPTTWRRPAAADKHAGSRWRLPPPASSAFFPADTLHALPRKDALILDGLYSVVPDNPRPVAFLSAQPRVGQAASKQQGDDPRRGSEALDFEPPAPDRLFRLETDARVRRRMEAEAARETPPQKLVFPEVPDLPHSGGVVRQPLLVREVEPAFVCHAPLLFEEKNSERYGWDLGPIQPALSAGHFFGKTILLPWELTYAACHPWECSAGLFLPGTPVPYCWYLPREPW